MSAPTNTHLLVQDFEYLEPRSLDEALTLVAKHGTTARLMAGGTDLLVQMKMERRNPDYVISLAKIPNLCCVLRNADDVEIGAITTIRSVYKSPIINQRYAALGEACNWFSTIQIMIMGTLGGNLCNASPAADTAPPLLCFDAQAVIASPGGERAVPLDQFFLGPGKTVLRPDEILTSVRLPQTSDESGSSFLKMGRVVADISKVCAAVSIAREGKRVKGCRIALGSVGPTPILASRASSALIGQSFTPELAEHVAQIASDEIAPITDVRSTREYRLAVSRVLVLDALNRAWSRAGGLQQS